MKKSFEAMTTRAVNAENSFIESLVEIAGITEAEAVKVMNLYLKEKIAKLDYGIGRINVKHEVVLSHAAPTNFMANGETERRRNTPTAPGEVGDRNRDGGRKEVGLRQWRKEHHQGRPPPICKTIGS